MPKVLWKTERIEQTQEGWELAGAQWQAEHGNWGRLHQAET